MRYAVYAIPLLLVACDNEPYAKGVQNQMIDQGDQHDRAIANLEVEVTAIKAQQANDAKARDASDAQLFEISKALDNEIHANQRLEDARQRQAALAK